jgi:arsenite/tail-anchored protein-transporting ATPase
VRTLLFTGKGGVGKTTVAAATALRCAERGQRTLVISTDPAHSLADALERPLDGGVRAIAPDLWGQQLDAQERMEESWGEIREYLLEVFDWAGVNGIAAEELAVLPGLDEMFALADIKQIADDGDWDVLVVDCAPTAETIRLLSLPDVLEWYMDRVFPVGRRLNRVVGPVLARVTSLPMADDHVFGTVHRLYQRLEGVKALLTDPERTSIRLVVNPERMVIAEARRTHTYLSLFGYRVDAVVANRILPDRVADPWFAGWKEAQAAHVVEIEEGFAPLPVLRVGWAPEEPVGLVRLAALAGDLYGEGAGAIAPEGVLQTTEPFSITREDGRFVLRLALPFATREDIDLVRANGELLVKVGPYRRSVALPDSLRRRSVADAHLHDGVLRVAFADSRASSEPTPRSVAAQAGSGAAVAGAANAGPSGRERGAGPSGRERGAGRRSPRP